MDAALPEQDRLRPPSPAGSDGQSDGAGAGAVASPLSFTQEGIWFIGELEGENAIHHMAQAFRLSGPLDQELLERSLRALI